LRIAHPGDTSWPEQQSVSGVRVTVGVTVGSGGSGVEVGVVAGEPFGVVTVPVGVVTVPVGVVPVGEVGGGVREVGVGLAPGLPPDGVVGVGFPEHPASPEQSASAQSKRPSASLSKPSVQRPNSSRGQRLDWWQGRVVQMAMEQPSGSQTASRYASSSRPKAPEQARASLPGQRHSQHCAQAADALPRNARAKSARIHLGLYRFRISVSVVPKPCPYVYTWLIRG
jgi:hypothetical protein